MSRNKRQQKRRQQSDYVAGLLNGKLKNRNSTLTQLENGNPSMTRDQILQQEALTCREVDINYSEFAKSDAEKAHLKQAKKEHTKFLRAAGFSHKLRLNVASPITIAVQ